MKRSIIDDQYAALVAYLDVKRQQKDWHGVRDACVDIEVLVAVHPELESRDELAVTAMYL